ncbi:MAG: hypothetical protein OXH98_08775 [Caldilineaceae bacterium]|nr:hypothetical protein [Caldilineaceae bacterium]
MKRQSRMKFHLLVAVTLAILLAVALAGTALASPPGNHQPGNQPGNNDPVGIPPGNDQGNNPGNNPGNNDPGNNPGNNDPGNNPGNNDPVGSPPGGTTQSGHPDSPSSPSGNCIVAHAATPAQLCPVAGGLQYYFIGADGSSSIGPYLSPFGDLASLYTTGATVLLYNGINPSTGKSVQINFLPTDQKIRVSTYYPDTQYDINKAYVFTVDSENSVVHEAW